MTATVDLTPYTGFLFDHFQAIAVVGGLVFTGGPLLLAAQSRKPREEADGSR
jgi:hypothetical protein